MEPEFAELMDQLVAKEQDVTPTWSDHLVVHERSRGYLALLGHAASAEHVSMLDERRLTRMHERIPLYLGTWLRLLRIGRDVSESRVARACHCSQPTVSRIEHGTCMMQASHLKGYADAMNLSFEDLVDALDDAVLGMAYHE